MELDGNNAIDVDADDTPELAKRLREAKLNRLPKALKAGESIQFDPDGNILVESS